jgi:formyl-CoA transferase
MEKAEFYREARGDLTGPLAGIRVLEATTTLAGPLCGSLLADFGADVIKVESPAGEVIRRLPPFLPGTQPPLAFGQAIVNRNKRSLTLDLHHERGQQLFLEVARRCDIVVENFRPGTMDEWGLGYAGVRAVRPDVIYISISGFGQFGPDSERVAYDPLAQALSGFLSLNGARDGEPVKSGIALADDLTGLHGALAALAALAHRQRTGEGQHVDVSLLDSMLYQSDGALTLAAMGAPPERWGNEYIFATPANCYPCKQGHVYIATLLDHQWAALAHVMGRPELAEHADFASILGRLQHRDEVNHIVSAWCAEHAASEIAERCTEQSIPAAPVRSFAEAARDPHVAARDMLQPIVQEEGTEAPIVGPVAKLSRTPTRVRTAAPGLGAHTDEILDELGIPAAERAALRDDGIV